MQRLMIAAILTTLFGVPLASAGIRHAAGYPGSTAVLGHANGGWLGSRDRSSVPRRASGFVGDGHEPGRSEHLLADPRAEPCD